MKAKTLFEYTQDEAKKMYPAFFTIYGETMPNKIPEVVKDCFENSKSSLREVFPLDGYGRVLMAEYETNIVDMVRHSLPNTVDAIRRIVYRTMSKNITDKAVVEGRLDSGEKLSKRLLGSVTPDNHRTVTSCLENRDLCLELPRLPLSKRYDLECVLQNFYSEVAKLRDAKLRLVLSANPYDIMNAGNARFRSCNSLGGAYEQAPISAASSPHMAIVRLENANGEMLGRNYIAFGPDYKSITLQPTYGFMSAAYLEDALVWIVSVLNKKFPLPTRVKWAKKFGGSGTDAHVLSDAEYGVFYTDPTRSTLIRSDCAEFAGVRVGDCYCLFCGKKDRGIMCSDCRNNFTSCRGCRKLFPHKGAETSWYCPECAGKLRACKHCGREFVPPAADTEHVVYEYCSSCYIHNVPCINCDKRHKIYRNVRTPGHTDQYTFKHFGGQVEAQPEFIMLIQGQLGIHKECLEKDIVLCKQCGGFVKSIFNEDLCSKCRSINSSKLYAKTAIENLRHMHSRFVKSASTFDPTKIKTLGSLRFPEESALTDYAIAA